LDHNGLSGEIPASLCDLRHLVYATAALATVAAGHSSRYCVRRVVYMNNNQLSGPIPDAFGESWDCRHVYLHHPCWQ
jgi:hypothetical protein